MQNQKFVIFQATEQQFPNSNFSTLLRMKANMQHLQLRFPFFHFTKHSKLNLKIFSNCIVGRCKVIEWRNIKLVVTQFLSRYSPNGNGKFLRKLISQSGQKAQLVCHHVAVPFLHSSYTMQYEWNFVCLVQIEKCKNISFEFESFFTFASGKFVFYSFHMIMRLMVSIPPSRVPQQTSSKTKTHPLTHSLTPLTVSSILLGRGNRNLPFERHSNTRIYKNMFCCSSQRWPRQAKGSSVACYGIISLATVCVRVRILIASFNLLELAINLQFPPEACASITSHKCLPF